jgi:subtilase family serine protease
MASDLGEVASDRLLSAVSLHFNLTDAQQADLTQLLQDQQNPASPLYHQWLTPQQYGARFGLSTADLQKVQTWLTSQGLKVLEVSPSRNYVTVSGSAGQVERAFSTTLHSLSYRGEQHFSNTSDPQLPTPIAALVTSITGLNDFKPRSHAVVKPHFTSSTSGSHFIAPGDFNTIYDVPPSSQGLDGTGISIAVVGQTDISLPDVAAFRSAAGLPAKAPQLVKPPVYVAGTVSGDLDEAQLDVEWAGAVAPNATINFVTVGASSSASVVDALYYAISNNVAPIISMSYGNCESAWGQSNINAVNQALQQANAQGITFISSSGDAGATDCDTLPPADLGLTVDFPGSSPFATSAGGTMFNEGSATGGTSYWSAATDKNTDNVSSAKGYIPETVWNESTSTSLGSGGGGVSSYFAKPTWQQGITPADGSRDVPDISLNAAANHDGYLFCSQGSCTNGFRNSAGNLNVVGGTSAVAPALAGIFALLEQKLGGGTAGRLGNINPVIYGFGSGQYYGNAFHDITSGNNNSTCQQGTTNCPSGGSIGYSAGPGYDLATGWGSLNVAELINKWSIVTPAGTSTGSGATTGTNLSSTAITSSAALCSITGQQTLTITIANGSSAATLPNPPAPTGTVKVLVDGTAPSDGGVVQLTNGVGTYQLAAQSKSGQHTITAVYSGDATYATSKGTLLADFVSSSNPDFALTPCTNSTTVASGATAAGIPFTLTSANNFSGPVTFTVSADSAIAANIAFSSSSVNVSAGTPGTTTLTIIAAQSTATANLHQPGASRNPWYSGTAVSLAGIFLWMIPTRRRRFAPLLAIVVTIGAFSLSGCGGGSSSSPRNSGGGTPTTNNTSPGTYILNVTATAANGITHTSVVTLTVK